MFFPEICYLCGNPLKEGEDIFCLTCRPKLPLAKMYCRRCGELFSPDLPSSLEEKLLYGCKACAKDGLPYDFTFLGFLYEEPLSILIEKAKFGGDFVLAYRLGKLLRSFLPSLPYDFDLACAVPLSTQRQKERGYNQAELMLWGFLGKRPKNNPLIRAKHTLPQTQLDRKERINNVKGAFICQVDLKGKKVLLFDDVMTTGATLRECAKVLKKAKAEKVGILALARTPWFP